MCHLNHYIHKLGTSCVFFGFVIQSTACKHTHMHKLSLLNINIVLAIVSVVMIIFDKTYSKCNYFLFSVSLGGKRLRWEIANQRLQFDLPVVKCF